MIYSNITTQIQEILETVTEIKQIVNHPTANLSKYPAVVFFPADVNNSFNTSGSNFKEYRYKLYVLIGVDASTMSHVFATVLPKACDAVLQAIDSNWSFNSIGSHRVWSRVENGNWGISKTDKGLTAYAEFNLIIKLSTTN